MNEPFEKTSRRKRRRMETRMNVTTRVVTNADDILEREAAGGLSWSWDQWRGREMQ